MKILKPAAAGTLESNDVLISLSPSPDETIVLTLDSIVKKQFGRQIEQTVRETLNAHDITAAQVYIQDKGALDCVIKARTEAAILRALREETVS